MNTKEVKEKGIKGIKTVIYGRTLFVVAAFLIQFVLLFIAFIRLREYSFIIYGFFILLSVIVVLRLFNREGTPDFKLVWMLPMVMLPVFGALFYLYIDTQPGTRILKKRLHDIDQKLAEFTPQNVEIRKSLEKENVQLGRFADYMQSCDNSPVYGNTQAVYYPLGDDQFPDMIAELKKAEKFIFMEYFIVEEGYLWESVLTILEEKARQGVEIRFMYDDTCSLWYLPNFYPRLLEKEGIRCKTFCPIKPIFSSIYNNRDHRKIIVIDGKVAFTGGTNLADEYINKKMRFGHWKDTAIMLKGAAVERLTYLFLEMWSVSEHTEEDYGKYKCPSQADVPWDGYFIPYGASPFSRERVGKRVYLDILNTACHYVHIMTPYLILDNEMMMALTYAARRGVEVVIIMPHIPDKQYAFAVAKTYYNELLEGGVRICEYLPGFVHAKIFVSDDERAVVGTINLDYRGLYHHFECGVLLYRNSQIGAVERDFQETLEKCVEMGPEDYRKQNLFVRLEGRLLKMLAPLM